ncbi:MAG: hypothetical protein KF865_06575, partial [Bdellovibrionaceae bacterium]|nr:hypothetical protein [Pseudobdellovibrionaceae bacterium]
MAFFGVILTIFFSTAGFAATPMEKAIDALTPPPPGGIVTERVSGVELHFFSEIAEVLQSLSRKDQREPAEKTTSLCERDLRMNEDLARSCPALAKNIEELRATAEACRDMEDPMRIYTRLPAGEPSAEALAKVEGILETVLVLATKVSWPDALQKRTWEQRLRNLILKIKHHDLNQSLLARSQVLARLQSAVSV